MVKRRSAAEIIAFHFGWDMRDVSETRYQPSKYTSQAIYVIGDDYYCAPVIGQRPKWPCPGKAWRELAEHYGRKIYISECETV